MGVYQFEITINTSGKGTQEVSGILSKFIADAGVQSGIVSVFCHHTSCSLVLMENADPSATQDLENYMERLVPEDLPYFVHTYEGPDDMPSHIKMALTRSSETIPFSDGSPNLGTWQGLFLWEHRTQPHRRRLSVTVVGE